MERETRSVDVTPQDIANALNGISDWVRSVRSAVLRMDPATAATLELPMKMESASPPSQAAGCPPPHPANRKKKKKAPPKPKKRKKTRTH